jgi:hypothetical protein
MGWFKKPAAVLFHEDTESVAGNPHSGLIRAVLAMGLEVGAKEIVFGVPAGVTLDEAAQRADEDKGRAWARENVGYREPEAWVTQSLPLVLENGLDAIPMYYLVDGKYERYQGFPAVMWSYIPVFFEMLRVAIGQTKEHPQPRRYIELESKAGRLRRFAEVELVMGRDNALRFRLLGTREEDESVSVFPDISRPLALEPEEAERVLKRAREWAAQNENRAGGKPAPAASDRIASRG